MGYSEFVNDLCKPGEKIQLELTPRDCHLIHMVLGVSGEAGELLDAIKKHAIYRKPIDLVNIVEELGDIEFYLEGIRQALNLDREQIIKNNMMKLSKRYSQSTYSDEEAQSRKDKL
jgi:NTP pyrophosphatase (non-canonical NTP hydrolase)